MERSVTHSVSLMLLPLALLMLLQPAVADNVTRVHYLGNGTPAVNQTPDIDYNGTGPQYNDTNLTANAPPWSWPQINLPSVNTTQIGGQIAQSGDAVSSFLAAASPYLLIIVGIIVLVLVGFVKILGIALILLGAFKILADMFGWKLW